MNTAFKELAYEATAATCEEGGSSRIIVVLCLTRSMICDGGGRSTERAEAIEEV